MTLLPLGTYVEDVCFQDVLNQSIDGEVRDHESGTAEGGLMEQGAVGKKAGKGWVHVTDNFTICSQNCLS